MRLCSTLSSLWCVGWWSIFLLCVYNNIITLIRLIAVMFVLTTTSSPSFCGRPLVSNVLAINTLEPSSNTLRLVIRLHPNKQQPLQLFVGHSLASKLTSYPGSFPVPGLYPGSFPVPGLVTRLISCSRPRNQAHFLFRASARLISCSVPRTQAHFLFCALYPGSFPVPCLVPRLISCFVSCTQVHFLFRVLYPGSFPVSCLVPRLISSSRPRTQAHFLFRASYPGLVPRLISCFVPRTQAHFLFRASYPGSFLYKKEPSTSMYI